MTCLKVRIRTWSGMASQGDVSEWNRSRRNRKAPDKRSGKLHCYVSISPILLKRMREDNNSWKLPSNRGWKNTSWFIRGEAEIEGERFLLVEVVMTGKYWNRFKLAQHKGYDLARDHYLVMPQFLISVSRLKNLQKLMGAYLNRPINQMAHNPPEIS